jgi:oxygen-independent coproporphyrinogen-3 oxidase
MSTIGGKLDVRLALLKKYNVPGPRYTSYPTAPNFRENFKEKDFLAGISRSIRKNTPLSLYFHFPFCRSLCWYCACNATVTHRRERIAEYLSYLCKEMIIIRKIIGDNHRVMQLHWGGGSPSYLNIEELKEMNDFIDANFPIHLNAEVGIELDPRDLGLEDILNLKRCGFNRISLGVQDFDDRVQKAVSRIQSFEHIESLYITARGAGFDSINMDFIYGLPGQTVDSFARTLERTIKLSPDRIALFNFAYLPAQKRHQRLIRKDQLPAPETKLNILKMSIERLTGAGYNYIGMDHFAKPEDELSIAQSRRTLHRNFQGYSTKAGCDLFAFGITGISQLGGIYSQNYRTFKDYYAPVEKGSPPVYRGIRLDRDDEIRRHVIMRIMCDMFLDFKEVEQEFNIKFKKYFKNDLARLKGPVRDRLVKIRDHTLEVSRTGRLFIRNIAMVFDRYLRKSPKGRGRFSKTV